MYYLKYNEDQKLQAFWHAGGHQAQAKRNRMNNYFTSLENRNWPLSHLNCSYPFKNEYLFMKAEP